MPMIGMPMTARIVSAVSHQSGKWWEADACRCGGFTAGMTHGDPAKGGRHGDAGLTVGRQGLQPVTAFIDQAKAVAIPLDREVIHVLPQEFVVDDQDGVKEPVGMSGVRLEAKALIVTGAVSSAQNIVKCAQRTGLNVADIVLQPLASSLAVH